MFVPVQNIKNSQKSNVLKLVDIVDKKKVKIVVLQVKNITGVSLRTNPSNHVDNVLKLLNVRLDSVVRT